MKKRIVFIILIILSAVAFGQSSIEYLQTDEASTSRIRPNLYYDLPLGIEGFTFIEFYTDKSSEYYGETYLTKNVIGMFGVRADIFHTSLFEDVIGFGIYADIVSNDNLFFQLKYIPAYFEFRGIERWKRFGVLGYCLAWDFTANPLGRWQLNSFADFNIHAQELSYGEIYLDKYVTDDFLIGLGADLRTIGEAAPEAKLGIDLKFMF